MGLTSPFWDGNGKNHINCVPPMRDRNGNYQKASPLFGTGTGNPKNYSRCSGTGIQGVSVGKYKGTEIPAHACYEGAVSMATTLMKGHLSEGEGMPTILCQYILVFVQPNRDSPP